MYKQSLKVADLLHEVLMKQIFNFANVDWKRVEVLSNFLRPKINYKPGWFCYPINNWDTLYLLQHKFRAADHQTNLNLHNIVWKFKESKWWYWYKWRMGSCWCWSATSRYHENIHRMSTCVWICKKQNNFNTIASHFRYLIKP